MSLVQVYVPNYSGDSSLSVFVYKSDGSLVNPGGDALTEIDSTGYFQATLTQKLDLPFYELRTVKDGRVVDTDTRLRAGGSAAVSSAQQAASGTSGQGGYEFTGGFLDRTTGTAGASDVGSNVNYTQDMVDNKRWLRFAFDSAQQLANDSAYWSDPAPAPTAGIGLFGGSYMPEGVTNMFDFNFNVSTYSDAVEAGDFQYTAANGSFDFSHCKAGDLALVRFDYNILPQIANTTVETALIWQTRDSNDSPTFTFALTGEPKFFGTGSVGQTYLARPLLSAYFASNEDVNARALLAIRADNPVQVQPLTTLTTIQR